MGAVGGAGWEGGGGTGFKKGNYVESRFLWKVSLCGAE